MQKKTLPTEKEIAVQLTDMIEKCDPGELRIILEGFLTRGNNLRDFIQYCGTQAKIDGKLHSGWTILGENLAQLERREKEDSIRKEKAKFLKDLEQFKGECLSGEYSLEADFDDKRRAYADGDIYFEEFIYDFFDDHPGIQGYIHYMKEALRYYDEGDFRTVSKAMEILIGIYGSDTEGKSIFIDDDDFPDADLSEVPGVDIDKMRKFLKISEENIR